MLNPKETEPPMICTNQTQATKVAGYGAAKMDAQNYTYELVTGSLYLVTKLGQKPYMVELDTEMIELVNGEFCTCEFAKANQSYGTCKHKVWVEQAIADGAPYEDEAQARNDYEAFGKYL